MHAAVCRIRADSDGGSFRRRAPVAVLLKRIIARPILDLVEATKTDFQERNFSIRAPKYAKDEMGLLVDDFNEMLA